MSYLEFMISSLESNLMMLREEIAGMEHYPEITGTVISKYVRCSRPNCSVCAAGFYHGPNLYYRYYEDGELKDKYLGKMLRDEYIHKCEANKKYNEVAAEIKKTEAEFLRLRKQLQSGGETV